MKTVLFLTICILLLSCAKEKKRPVYFSEVPLQEESVPFTDSDEVVIPFRKEGGVKYVPVKINGLACDMIFDTGCSLTLISLSEAAALYQKRRLQRDKPFTDCRWFRSGQHGCESSGNHIGR